MEEWTRKSYEINFAPTPTMAAGCSSGSSSNQASVVATCPSPLAAHSVKAVALKRKFALLGGGARVASQMTPTTETPLEVSEFDLYKRTPAAPLDPEMIDDPFVVFKWWSDRIDQFPNMARMAQQFLACPASSAGVERLFCGTGATMSERRTGLTGDTMQHILKTKSCGKA